ncbi:uncharacterized protein LOC112083425 [Eutrema salsugineum]|uniref:uncharacterized protein LOC112083425 n=1 Tax=Eutrema salsugineum TaxID=72664 RepID=UPI000CED5513|nr:uncharacterized protein LOC112083425 [Eutrema salsugineum]
MGTPPNIQRDADAAPSSSQLPQEQFSDTPDFGDVPLPNFPPAVFWNELLTALAEINSHLVQINSKLGQINSNADQIFTLLIAGHELEPPPSKRQRVEKEQVGEGNEPATNLQDKKLKPPQ